MKIAGSLGIFRLPILVLANLKVIELLALVK